ncbi:MAG TPA: extracellular solute-binding protein [Streptosporangiaceae bacterium]|jgi:iron(III) transport system substrate-binding protein
MTRRIAAAAAGMALTCGMLAACSAAASTGSTLTLYSGQHLQTAQNLVAAFEKKTGITVSIRSDDEDALADQIVTEGSHSPADVFFTENTPPLEFLQGKGLLAHLDPGTLGATPARYRSAAGDWTGISARTSVLIYNPALISPGQLPAHVLQLASPAFKGKLAIAPQETDFQPIVTSIIDAYGKPAALSWLKGIKANAGSSHNYPDNETVADEVNRGAVAFGLVNQYYWYRMRAEIGAGATKARITHLAPRDPGYVIDVAGAAVLKSSRHQKAAQELVAFLTSKQGQEIIANPAKSISFEYPIDSGVTTMAGETPLRQLQPVPLSLSRLGTGSLAVSLLRQAGLL